MILAFRFNQCFCLCLLLFLATNVLHPAYASSVDTTQQTSAIHGNFEQVKRIPALKRSLVTKGEFVYQPSRQLMWKTLHPFKITRLFTAKGVFKIDEQGKQSLEYQISGEFFLALLDNDQQKLALYFQQKQVSDACVHLLPKTQKKITTIKFIELCTLDSTLPKSIKLHEESGSLTEIKFDYSMPNTKSDNNN